MAKALAELLPCEVCTDPERFREVAASIDKARNLVTGAVNILVDAVATESRELHAISTEVDVDVRTQQHESILDQTIELDSTTQHLDKSHDRALKRLKGLDCTVYCRGTPVRCPKLDYLQTYAQNFVQSLNT